MLGRRRHRVGHVVFQRLAVVDDLHGAAAQNIRGPDQHRIAQPLGDPESFIEGTGDAVVGLLDAQLRDQRGKTLAVFGQIDAIGRSADDRHAGALQRQRQLERGLAAELNDDAVGFFPIDNVHHFFHGQRFEIKFVGSVVIGADGFRIAVDHDGLITLFPQSEGGMDAAIVELDTLADPIRPAAEDHDFLALGAFGFVLAFVGGIKIGRERLELRAAGVDRIKHRFDAFFFARLAHGRFARSGERGDAGVGEAHLLPAAQCLRVNVLTPGIGNLTVGDNQLANLFEKPRIVGG